MLIPVRFEARNTEQFNAVANNWKAITTGEGIATASTEGIFMIATNNPATWFLMSTIDLSSGGTIRVIGDYSARRGGLVEFGITDGTNFVTLFRDTGRGPDSFPIDWTIVVENQTARIEGISEPVSLAGLTAFFFGARGSSQVRFDDSFLRINAFDVEGVMVEAPVELPVEEMPLEVLVEERRFPIGLVIGGGLILGTAIFFLLRKRR